MQELEKILEEIDIKVAGSMGKKREGLLEAQDIIRKHMNDGWIPVDERLPDECGKYLCTVECMGHRYAIVGHYNNPGWTDNYCGQKVIAWRPLPESYRPKSKTPEEMQEWKIRMMQNFMRKSER